MDIYDKHVTCAMMYLKWPDTTLRTEDIHPRVLHRTASALKLDEACCLVDTQMNL